MRAVIHDRYGGPDVLRIDDLAAPVPAPGEVLVRVRTAAVNPGDGYLVRGVPYVTRLMALRGPRQRVPGTDVSGEVEAVGDGVTRFEPGDPVFGFGQGTFAEYVTVPEAALAPKPASVTFEQAAAVPTAAFTALQGLRDRGRIRRGQRVLVVGASGGVGTFAIQIAKAFGAHVTGVCSTRNIDLVRSAGADDVVDYTREDFARGPGRYDLVLDMVGDRPLSAAVRALTARGTYVVVGAPAARSLTGMGRFMAALVRSPFTRRRLRPLFSAPSGEDLAALADLLAAGRILPVIDREYDLHDVAGALRHVEAGHARGKVVLTVRGRTAARRPAAIAGRSTGDQEPRGGHDA
jgi:NADPH:quinone reductase-like Zn-dependent oxidoreductase